MIKEVKLPEVSDNIEHGDVVKVLVKIGDKIESDQPIIELETDKAMFEVPSSENGIVKEINVKAGDVIAIGQTILKVETNGAEKLDIAKKETNPLPETKIKSEPESATVKSTSVSSEVKAIESKIEDTTKQLPTGNEIQKSMPGDTDTKQFKESAPASPSVRRFARELGVDINEVKKFSSGRIKEEDIKNFVKQMTASRGGNGAPIAARELPDFRKWGEVDIQPMSKVRSITADSLSYAWSSIPMVTQFDEADITSLEKFRKDNQRIIEDKGGHLTITSILLKVCSAALKTFPQFNSSIDMIGKQIMFKKYFNIGVAVDTDRGLLVPVIRNIDAKSITELSIELTQLSEKARNKKITPDEMDGGNFTISNLGGIGGTSFTPIVYSPQVAILGVSRGSVKGIYDGSEFHPRLMLPLSLTYDHRIIDGADAARFLKWICRELEYPLSTFL